MRQVSGDLTGLGTGREKRWNGRLVVVVIVVFTRAADGAHGEGPGGIGGLERARGDGGGAESTEHVVFWCLEDECWDADVAEEDEHAVTPKCDLERHVFPLLPEADDRGWAGRAPEDKRAPA